jgi:isopenicillin N synthase-like dioxygenase
VNVGDMLQLCTEQYYKSTTHRVTNPQSAEGNIPRYSMPFFLHGRDEVMLSPTQNYAECLNQRLREIGIY